MMFEQRKKRSEVREEALQYLIEAVLDRSEVRCAAIIDSNHRVVAGAGEASDLFALAKLAQTVARGGIEGLEASLDADDDIIAREIATSAGPLTLAAFGKRVRKMPSAVHAVTRICSA